VRPDSVAQLFERANQLRRQGRVAAAERAYAALVARHPRATEAGLARLSLADLLAAEGRHGAALAQADAYLRVTADGALTEEALQRKARALEALGRTTAARAAWRALLDRNPASVYRAEAEQKLARPTRP
jgi:outer membrane protein assembly factor BamD (BamD/ComL family)